MWNAVVGFVTLPLMVVAAACSSNGPDAPTTYYGDVKPLIDLHCTQCHRPAGIAPFPLTTFEEVVKRSATIRAAVESRAMPPWFAAPGCTDYAGDPSLNDDQIATISDWVSSGDPRLIFSFFSGGLVQIDKPVTLHQIGPHMHTLGTKATLALQHADGSRECMIDIPRWDFHWQRLYAFSRPKTLQPGETMSIECHWNNPGDATLNWGEGSGDEMCTSFVYVTQ